ncbi:hypothetical protein [Roseovarius albus]|nr:hypothetical protein [Roseovarius albus]
MFKPMIFHVINDLLIGARDTNQSLSQIVITDHRTSPNIDKF